MMILASGAIFDTTQRLLPFFFISDIIQRKSRVHHHLDTLIKVFLYRYTQQIGTVTTQLPALNTLPSGDLPSLISSVTISPTGYGVPGNRYRYFLRQRLKGIYLKSKVTKVTSNFRWVLCSCSKTLFVSSKCRRVGTVVLQKVQGIPPSWWFPTVTNGLLSLVTVTLVATAPVARFGLESRYRLRAVLQAFLRFWVRVSFFIEAVFGIGNLPLSPCNSTVLTLITTSSYNIHRYFDRKNRRTASGS